MEWNGDGVWGGGWSGIGFDFGFVGFVEGGKVGLLVAG